METIAIGARNNLSVPIRLTLTKVGYDEESTRILITIGNEGVALKDYYRVCVDTDLPPNQEWKDVGLLNIATKCIVSFEGKGV